MSGDQNKQVKAVMYGLYPSGGDMTINSGQFLPIKLNDDGGLISEFGFYDLTGGTFTLAAGLSSGADGVSNNFYGFSTVGFNFLYNDFNGTWDRQRNNSIESLLPLAARTASTGTDLIPNYNFRGGHFVIRVTAVTGAASITPRIWGSNGVIDYDILNGAAISTTGVTILKVYPGITASLNASANDILPAIFGVDITNATADSITYSVGFLGVL